MNIKIKKFVTACQKPRTS